jgi:hypothetical protein
MARFHALLLAAVIGAVLGTMWRPGIPEIVIVAGMLAIVQPIIARTKCRRTASSV